MKLLLDTNIIIHRESSNAVKQGIGILFNWIDKLGYEKWIHPTTVSEIQKYQDDKVVRVMSVKLDSYNLMPTVASVDSVIKRMSQTHDKTDNDLNDTQILNEVYRGRMDALITEDRKIHRKAALLSIADKVFTIDSFLEKVNSENPKLKDYKVLAVRKEYFGNIDINDPFFDSFKEDYEGFEKWFAKKSDNIAYICTGENSEMLAFLYVKVEGIEENYSDITPPFQKKKRLKIGTFKVVANGFKLGERFLKIIFDNAQLFKVDEIYVTIFNRTEDQYRLIQLLSDWGFLKHGEKATPTGLEFVYCRDFKSVAPGLSPKISYPFISKSHNNIWVVPIYPDYHTDLLPDSILKTESPNSFVENEPHRNAISKVYVSWSRERGLNRGDIIVFYRTADGGSAYHTAVVSTIGVVESAINNIPSESEFISLCRKRSVFTDDELSGLWNRYPTYKPFIVNFLYVYSFPRRPNRKALIDAGIFSFDYAPRGFEKISVDSFERILKLSQSDESFIID